MSQLIKRPAIREGEHPVESGDYVINTPPIEETFRATCRWIRNRIPGGMVTGVQRIGKTRCTMFLPHLIKEEFGTALPIYTVDCEFMSKMPEEGRFYSHLLESVGHADPVSGKIYAKKIRFVEHLKTTAALGGEKRIVIILDEAQNLQSEHYGWLVGITNQLDRKHIRTIFLLFGQKELEHVRSCFVAEGRRQIVGRFMVQRHHFRALESLNDVQSCLAQYDELTEYPESSEWSYTRYYFPTAFSKGWRLSHCASAIWESFVALRKSSKVAFEKNFYIPMQEFTRTVEFLLREYSDMDAVVLEFTAAHIERAIDESGFLEVLSINELPPFIDRA